MIRQPIIQALILTVLIFGTAYYQLNFPHYEETIWYEVVDKQIHNRKVYESWTQKTPEGCHIFNVNGANNCFSYALNGAATFFSGRDCYADLPSYGELKAMQDQGIAIAIIDMPGLSTEEYLTDSTFIHLAPDVMGF